MQCCGYEINIPDLQHWKNGLQALKNMIHVVHSGSWIPNPDHHFLPTQISDPGVKKALHSGCGSATLHDTYLTILSCSETTMYVTSCPTWSVVYSVADLDTDISISKTWFNGFPGFVSGSGCKRTKLVQENSKSLESPSFEVLGLLDGLFWRM